MKSRIIKSFALLFVLFSFSLFPLHAQNREAAFEMNRRLGRGINMGNTFEAPAEGEWGNPWKPEYFRMMSELGFTHVRIPIRWEPAMRSSAHPPYTITGTFLNRIREVVDTALKYKLHAIINMHHHDVLLQNPDGQKARFLAQWDQIANFFQEYPDSLIFEILNEPHNLLNSDKWNQFLVEALGEIRKSNPDRIVMIGTADWGGLGSLNALQLPPDERIILTLHYYNPFSFTHQGADWAEGDIPPVGVTWLDTEAEREAVKSELRPAKAISEAKKIPVHIGEFGSYSTADMPSRERWTTFVARTFEELGFSWAYWEFSAGFGIYNPSTMKYYTPLVNALLHNSMPPPTPVVLTPVYTSNFTSGNDGWSLSLQGGAAGSLSRSNSQLLVALTNGGSEGWHAQLIRGNIKLEKGKQYQATVRASATTARSATLYIGRSGGDWGAYSGYHGFTFTPEEEEYIFTFTMDDESDQAARMVFDLGNNITGITLTSVTIEEVKVITTSEIIRTRQIMVYPNPAKEQIFFNSNKQKGRADIFSIAGTFIQSVEITGEVTSINVGHLPGGVYLLNFRSKESSESHKIIIN